MNAKKVGLFGGAFDPPHNAHVALARRAVAQLKLDELHICPTGNAWHRTQDLADAKHRVAMCRIAFADVPHATVDEREIHREGPTYTIDTLRELHAEQPAAELFLVMGEDQAASFTSWRDWQGLAALATLCIAHRRYATGSQPVLALPEGVRTVLLQLPIHTESATEVRRRLTQGQAITQLVAPGVARYIADHHLYQPA